MQPEVIRHSIFSMQVCVPADWSDEQAEQFANTENPAGTDHGWRMRKDGDPTLGGDPERASCHEREGCVHIMLDC